MAVSVRKDTVTTVMVLNQQQRLWGWLSQGGVSAVDEPHNVWGSGLGVTEWVGEIVYDKASYSCTLLGPVYALQYFKLVV